MTKKFIVVGLQMQKYNFQLEKYGLKSNYTRNGLPQWVRYPLTMSKVVRREWPTDNSPTFPTKLGARRLLKRIKKDRIAFLIEHRLDNNNKLPKQYKQEIKELISSWMKSTKYQIVQIGDD